MDLQSLTLPLSTIGTVRGNNRLPRHKQGEKFLKGPIPWNWITHAAQIKGHVMHVAIGLWFLAGLKGRRTITLTSSVMEDLGVERRTSYRALKDLESAGLITVERHAGRRPIVTLLDFPDQTGREDRAEQNG